MFIASIERDIHLFDAGIRNFGENKVQDLIEKMDVLKDYPIKWHFIGHLQKNKVKYLVDRECLIHSIDSVDLVREIEKHLLSDIGKERRIP